METDDRKLKQPGFQEGPCILLILRAGSRAKLKIFHLPSLIIATKDNTTQLQTLFHWPILSQQELTLCATSVFPTFIILNIPVWTCPSFSWTVLYFAKSLFYFYSLCPFAENLLRSNLFSHWIFVYILLF